MAWRDIVTCAAGDDIERAAEFGLVGVVEIAFFRYKSEMAGFLRLSRACGILVCLAGLAGVAVDAGSTPAMAQGFGWLGGLLGGGTPQRSYNVPAPGYDSGGGDTDSGVRRERRHRAQRRDRAPVDQAQQAAAAKAKTPAKDPTMFVGVFGDSLGVLLANGLDEAFADRPEVGILHKARGSTGLVTQSFYNWPKVIDDELAKQPKSGKDVEDGAAREHGDKADADKGKAMSEADKKARVVKDKEKDKDKPEKIDVAVMMIGINDRQPITENGKTYQRGTDEWTAIYRKRVTEIAEAFQKKKIPLVWVGIPITKNDDFADDMAALNEIYRDVADKTGATYVDTWEAFSDDNGNFAASGPDIDGQITRLRSADGIHFTPAGARKLAHFVEGPVQRDLDGRAPPPQLPTADVSPGDDKTKLGQGKDEHGKNGKDNAAKASVALVKPEAGPIRNLVEVPSAKDGQLAQAPRVEAPTSLDEAPTDKAPINRADNFRWPTSGTPQP